jgi:hypothetical protein
VDVLTVLHLQKMAAVETASAEERERLRTVYKQRMHDMDARLKVLCLLDQRSMWLSAAHIIGRLCFE